MVTWDTFLTSVATYLFDSLRDYTGSTSTSGTVDVAGHTVTIVYNYPHRRLVSVNASSVADIKSGLVNYFSPTLSDNVDPANALLPIIELVGTVMYSFQSSYMATHVTDYDDGIVKYGSGTQVIGLPSTLPLTTVTASNMNTIVSSMGKAIEAATNVTTYSEGSASVTSSSCSSSSSSSSSCSSCSSTSSSSSCSSSSSSCSSCSSSWFIAYYALP